MAAARLVVDRLLPAPRDRRISFALRPIACADDAIKASADILDALAKGQITPAEAEAVAKLLHNFIAASGPGPGPDDEINAIFRKHRGMKALRLAIEKARELKGEPTREDDDGIKKAVGLTGLKKLRQDMLRERDERRSREV
jgi:hypothetical protein